MKQAHTRRVLFIVALLISLTFYLLLSLKQFGKDATGMVSDHLYKTHILGGFTIDSLDRVARAASDGIQVAFNYDSAASPTDSLGQQLTKFHMKTMDSIPWTYLQAYECLHLHLQGSECAADTYPELTSVTALLKAIAMHLQQVRADQLIVGYWILDDWVVSDPGGAKALLPQIRNLIHEYTPGKPAICGFGAGLEPFTYNWQAWIAENFSPQGCDMLGLYIYADPSHVPVRSAASYDWTMSKLLVAIFSSLKQQGWNITRTPLIGIAEAWGIQARNGYFPTLTAQSIETQSRSFCQHGATGLVFYGWDDSSFDTITQTPMNSTEVALGIRDGIKACDHYWSNDQ